jgi:RecJ-like exonuclease
MRIENNRLILERTTCHSCHGTRRVNDWVKCESCNGTGKGSNRRSCKECGGNLNNSLIRGKKLAIGIKECTACDLDGTVPESQYDAMPDSFWQALTFKVYRSERHQTFAESLLGVGVYSTTDYGRHQSQTDEQLIEEIRKHTYIQAVKVTNKELNFCDHIGIFCNRNGYSVIPVYGKPEETQSDLESQLTAGQGIAIGTRLAGEGLNGTLLAAVYRKGK